MWNYFSKLVIFQRFVIADHFRITHKIYDLWSLTIMISKNWKNMIYDHSWSWSDRGNDRRSRSDMPNSAYIFFEFPHKGNKRAEIFPSFFTLILYKGPTLVLQIFRCSPLPLLFNKLLFCPQFTSSVLKDVKKQKFSWKRYVTKVTHF